MRSLLSIADLSLREILSLMRLSDHLWSLEEPELGCILTHKILATLFYEPSTRTRLSFESAMLRLWGRVVSESSVAFSSRAKGEDLSDTARVVSSFADIIALRSSQQGDILEAHRGARVPLINAWDGDGEHPTQALLDLYTIIEAHPSILTGAPKTIMIAGDLRYGRTTHSLLWLLAHFPHLRIILSAPVWLEMPDRYISSGVEYRSGLDDIAEVDALYLTRLQKERIPDMQDFAQAFAEYTLTYERALTLKSDAIILHPLPRLSEIDRLVDTLPQARYFDQVQNGVYMRMALLVMLLRPQYFSSFLSDI